MKKFWSIIAIFLLIVLLVGCVPDELLPATPPNSNIGTDTPVDTNPPDNTPPVDIDPPDVTTPDDDPPDVTPPQDTFNNYGLPVIEIHLSQVNVVENGRYTSMKEVGAYLYKFHKLPQNFVTKNKFNRSDVTKENKLSVGGDYFGNYEGLLPKGKSYRECDINYNGGSRNALRIVYSVNDWLIFYTSDHYKSFSILRFYA